MDAFLVSKRKAIGGLGVELEAIGFAADARQSDSNGVREVSLLRDYQGILFYT